MSCVRPTPVRQRSLSPAWGVPPQVGLLLGSLPWNSCTFHPPVVYIFCLGVEQCDGELWWLLHVCVFFTGVSVPLFYPFLLSQSSSSVSSSSSSHPSPSLLPLFRLCKVQLGFGAFGLQAWWQEDALSEYALLGSLCVTLHFFALLFCPAKLIYCDSFFLLTPVSVVSQSTDFF